MAVKQAKGRVARQCRSRERSRRAWRCVLDSGHDGWHMAGSGLHRINVWERKR